MLDPTDSFFLEAAREMLELTHYVTPLINYSDWLDKPAFPFICIIESYKIFGISEWAGRLPSALSGLFLVLYTFLVAKKFIGLRAAFFTCLILCSSPLFLIVAHVALTDMPLTMFIGVSLLAFAQALILKDKKSFLLAYFALALAVLCKGPIGLILVMASLALYLLFTMPSLSFRESLAKVKLLHLPVGLLIVIVVCLPYYILAHCTTGGAFTNAFFLRQNLGRFAGVVNHQEPFWFYLPVFLGGYFPWTFFLLASVPGLKRVWARRLVDSKRQAITAFCLSWLFVVLALFTIVPTKLPTYIVPMSPALAIIVSINLEALILLKRRLKLSILILIILLTSAAGIAVLDKILRAPATGISSLTGTDLLFCAGGSVLLMGQIASLFYLKKKLILRAVRLLCFSTYLGTAILVPLGFCRYYQSQQAGLTGLIELAKAKNANLATLFCLIPSATYCYKNKVSVINSLAEISAFCNAGHSPHWLLTMKNCFAIPELHANRHIVAHDGKWYLLSLEQYLVENEKKREN
jgi:4-amino-4-deoxy-L-arabinose transferase-like glycosyltransferase